MVLPSSEHSKQLGIFRKVVDFLVLKMKCSVSVSVTIF